MLASRLAPSLAKRTISVVTAVDRSVFPTAPWQEMEKASSSPLAAHSSSSSLTITPLPYNASSNSLVLSASSVDCEALVIGTRDEEGRKR